MFSDNTHHNYFFTLLSFENSVVVVQSLINLMMPTRFPYFVQQIRQVNRYEIFCPYIIVLLDNRDIKHPANEQLPYIYWNQLSNQYILCIDIPGVPGYHLLGNMKLSAYM